MARNKQLDDPVGRLAEPPSDHGVAVEIMGGRPVAADPHGYPRSDGVQGCSHVVSQVQHRPGLYLQIVHGPTTPP